MKKVFIITFLIITLFVNAQMIFNLKDTITEESSISFSPAIEYNYENDEYHFQINIFDTDFFYSENKIFGRTIKIKKGFRYFDFFINIPINNNKLGIGYEQRKKDSFFGALNTMSFQRTEVYTGGYSKLNYNLIEFFVPSYVKGSFFRIGNNTNQVFKLNLELQRWFKVPLNISYSDDYNISYKLVNFDNYNNEGLGIGISYDDGFFPVFFTDFSLPLFNQDLLVGLKAELKNDFGYEVSITNKNLSFPILFLIDEDSGGLFFEF